MQIIHDNLYEYLSQDPELMQNPTKALVNSIEKVKQVIEKS